jgi:VWFA-related protein
VSVRVTDNTGHPVSGLKKEDFELLVDGTPQPITVFAGEDAPVAAVILIDNSASIAPKGEEVLAAARAFARASNPQDEMAVVHFNQRVRLGLKPGTAFTGNIAELEEGIASFEPGGTTALYDAILFAQAQFRSASYGRRVLLIITDGGDNSSQARFSDALNAVGSDGVVLFAVGIFDPMDKDSNPRALAKLAKATGGLAYFPTDVAEVAAVCRQIAAEIRSQYTLGFAGAEDGKFHNIKVVTKNHHEAGKLDIRTRAGYFAAKP